jgi:hypothetical protein
MKTISKYRKIIFILALVLFASLFIVPATRKAVFSQGCTGTPNPNCSGGCCMATTQVWKLPNSSAQACTWRPSYCAENWITNFVVNCPGPRYRDCRTQNWDQGRCNWNAAGYCTRVRVFAQSTCCTAAGPGGPNPTPCTPRYYPPSITLGGYSSPYPLVITQDPDHLGVNVTINVQGGGVSNGCLSGNASLNSIQLNHVSLSQPSIQWIHRYLRLRYPGARVQGVYPMHPVPIISPLPDTNATLTFHLDPLDPGNYDVSVTATQSDGQSTTATLSVPVHMLDATIDQ